MTLYEKLKKEYPYYCKRKKTKTLKATCRYIEGCLGIKKYMTQHQIYLEYNVLPVTVGIRYKEIMKLLKIEE